MLFNNKLKNFLFEAATIIPTHGGKPIVAFCYHGIHSVGNRSRSVDRFSICTETLARHFQFILNIGRSVVFSAHLPSAIGPAIILTFDDNLKSHTSFALPLLREYGLKATFFISPNDICKNSQLVWKDVEEIVKSGMHLGAHNSTHRPASAFGSKDFVHSVNSCRNFLQRFGMPLTWAYPGGNLGSFKNRHERILIDNGFQVRYSTIEGKCQPKRLYRPQRRYVVRNETSDRYFKSAMEGKLQILAALKVIKYVIETHLKRID